MHRRKTKKSPELTKLCLRVEQWRRDSGGGGRGAVIPEELWQEAVRVAEVDGLYGTTQALRFNYMGLKRRMLARAGAAARAEAKAEPSAPSSACEEEGGPAMRIPRAQRSAAVPVPASQRFVPVVLPPPPRGGAITVEVERGAGERLRVEVPRDYDVVRLMQVLWRSPS